MSKKFVYTVKGEFNIEGSNPPPASTNTPEFERLLNSYKMFISKKGQYDLMDAEHMAYKAYEYFEIEHIVIPANLKTLGEYAFNRVTGIKSITFEENPQYKTIPEGFFNNISTYNYNSIKLDINFPDGITSIFYNNLINDTVFNSFRLPNTLIKIEDSLNNLKNLNLVKNTLDASNGLKNMNSLTTIKNSFRLNLGHQDLSTYEKVVELPSNLEVVENSFIDTGNSNFYLERLKINKKLKKFNTNNQNKKTNFLKELIVESNQLTETDLFYNAVFNGNRYILAKYNFPYLNKVINFSDRVIYTGKDHMELLAWFNETIRFIDIPVGYSNNTDLYNTFNHYMVDMRSIRLNNRETFTYRSTLGLEHLDQYNGQTFTIDTTKPITEQTFSVNEVGHRNDLLSWWLKSRINHLHIYDVVNDNGEDLINAFDPFELSQKLKFILPIYTDYNFNSTTGLDSQKLIIEQYVYNSLEPNVKSIIDDSATGLVEIVPNLNIEEFKANFFTA